MWLVHSPSLRIADPMEHSPQPTSHQFYIIVDHEGNPYNNHKLSDIWLAPSADISQFLTRVQFRSRINLRNVGLWDMNVSLNRALFQTKQTLHPLVTIGEIISTESNPIVVWISQWQQQTPAQRRTETYNGKDLLVATREFLKTILATFVKFYEFKRVPTTADVRLDDVLNARDGVEGVDWDFVKAPRNMRLRKFADGPLNRINKGERFTNMKLPDALGSPTYWALLEEMNDIALGHGDVRRLNANMVGELDLLSCSDFWD